METGPSPPVFTQSFSEKPVLGLKWYGKCEGLLDINPDGVPDYYLVMTGPKAWPTKSRPLVITGVFLFDAHELVNRLRERGVRLGVATGVRQHEWAATRSWRRRSSTGSCTIATSSTSGATATGCGSISTG